MVPKTIMERPNSWYVENSFLSERGFISSEIIDVCEMLCNNSMIWVYYLSKIERKIRIFIREIFVIRMFGYVILV